MKPHPEVVELDVDDLQSKLNQIEQRIGQEFAEPFRRLLGAYHMLQTLLRDKSISIQRLRKIIFGAASEKTSDVLESPGESLDSSTDDAANPSTTPPATSRDDTSGDATSGDATSGSLPNGSSFFAGIAGAFKWPRSLPRRSPKLFFVLRGDCRRLCRLSDSVV
jgi:hypothetical protein